jgi:putative ABC transport system permease protein
MSPSELWRRLRYYADKETFDRELEEEMRTHVEMKVEEKLASGDRPDEARGAAEREFGSRLRLLETSRDTFRFAALDSFLLDLRQAARALRKRPALTLVGVVSLGLGIGATTAVFTLLNTALLRPLPIEAPERLVSLSKGAHQRMFPMFSYPNYEDFRDRTRARVFDGLVAYRFAPLSLAHDGVAERTWGYLVSGNYFQVLGVEPALGRTITPEDDKDPGEHPVAVLSYRAWQGRFGGALDVVGKSIVLNGRTYVLVGVAPPAFEGTEVIAAPDLFVPMAMQAAIDRGKSYLRDREADIVFVQGRLAGGVGIDEARQSLAAVALELRREFPDVNEDLEVSLTPSGLMAGNVRSGVLGFTALLMGVAAFALLLTSTNVANLLLARAIEKRHEIGMSLALGAGRARVVTRLLAESLLLSLGGGLLGIALASSLVRVSEIWKPPVDVPVSFALHLDYRVLGFALLVSIAAGLLSGVLPALKVSKTEPMSALRGESARSRRSVRSGLVVVQVAVSLVLLVGCGLMVRGLDRARRIDLGFDPDEAVEVSFDLGLQGYDTDRGRELENALLSRARALPGVLEAGLADYVPVDLHFGRARVFIEGAPVPARRTSAPIAMFSRVSPGYFRAMRTRMTNGRDFYDTDDKDSIPVAVVNEAFARRFFPGEDALGKRFSFGGAEEPKVEVVGVIQDGKYAGLNEPPQPFFSLPLRQSYSGMVTLVARGGADGGSLIPSIRAEIRALDPQLPTQSARPLARRMELPLLPARIAASFLGGFAVVALLLAAFGIYGVMSQVMAQRRREMGIRVALGASGSDIIELAMRVGMIPTIVGIGTGLVVAVLSTRFLTTLLFGLSPTDLPTFAFTIALLGGVAAASCFLPAWKASRVSPRLQ